MAAIALTPEASEVLGRARAQATASGREGVASGELLAALLEHPTIARIIDRYGVELTTLTAMLGHFRSVSLHIELDEEVDTMQLAAAEAQRLGQAGIGPEHLLLALVRQPATLGGGILTTVGLSVDPTREAVRYLHGLVPDWDPPVRPEDGTDPGSGASVAMYRVLDAAGPGEHDEAEHGEAEDPLWWEEAERRWAAIADGEDPSGSLDGVVGVGTAIERSGVVVELIALELRSTMAIAHWHARSLEPRLLHEPEPAASDDLGTRYLCYPESSTGGEHGSRGQIAILPRPPASATAFALEFRSFGLDEGMPSPFPQPRSGEQLAGLWRFEVPLART